MILSVFKNDESETLIGMMYDEIIKNNTFPYFWLDESVKLDSIELTEDPSISWETRSYLTYRLNHFMTQLLMGDTFEVGSPGEQFEIMLKSFFNSKTDLEGPDPLIMESILHIAFIDLKGSIIIVSEIPLTEDV